MPLLDTLLEKRADLLRAAGRHGASNLRLFGSVARRAETPSSDVDILIDLAGDRGFSDFLALAEELEALIGRKVDLITSRGLSPYLKPLIEEEMLLLNADDCCCGTSNTASDGAASVIPDAREASDRESRARPALMV